MRRFRPLLIIVALLASCAALITIASRAGTSYSGVEYAGTPPHASESADYTKDVVTQGIAPLDPALISAAARDTAALAQTQRIAQPESRRYASGGSTTVGCQWRYGLERCIRVRSSGARERPGLVAGPGRCEQRVERRARPPDDRPAAAARRGRHNRGLRRFETARRLAGRRGC